MEIKQDFTAIGLLEHKSNNDFFFYWQIVSTQAMGFAHSLTHTLTHSRTLTHSAPQEPNVITIANRHHLFSTQMSTSNYLAVYLFQAFRPLISLDPFLLHHGVNPRGCFYVSTPLVRAGLANGTVKLRKTTFPWNSILLEILVGCSTHSLTHSLTCTHTHTLTILHYLPCCLICISRQDW